MKRLLIVIGLLLSYASPAAAQWTEGFNFRNTLGYCTDPADTQHAASTALYPVTSGGVTFGYLDAIGGNRADRNTSPDCRIAGIHYQPNDGTQPRFQVDLPATGNYTVCVAVGDNNSAQAYQHIEILDNTTSKFTVTDAGGTAAGGFLDATGVEINENSFFGSQTCQTGVSFATTTLILKFGSPSTQSGSTTIAHMQITQEASAGAEIFRRRGR